MYNYIGTHKNLEANPAQGQPIGPSYALFSLMRGYREYKLRVYFGDKFYKGDVLSSPVICLKCMQ